MSPGRITTAELTDITNAEIARVSIELDEMCASWRKFRDEIGAQYPELPPNGLLVLFVKTLTDANPHITVRSLFGILGVALSRFDRMEGKQR